MVSLGTRNFSSGAENDFSVPPRLIPETATQSRVRRAHRRPANRYAKRPPTPAQFAASSLPRPQLVGRFVMKAEGKREGGPTRRGLARLQIDPLPFFFRLASRWIDTAARPAL